MKKRAFTLVEVLIALFISSFIMIGMMQVYNNLQRFIDKTYSFIKFNKKVYLFFDQLEADVTSAFIDDLSKEQEKNMSDKVSNKSSKDKKTNEFFKTDIYLGERFRKKGKNLELFKSLSFVTTNVFKIYGEKFVNLVRIGYFLEKNKPLSKADKPVYDLYRKETFDTKNIDFKVSAEMSDKSKDKGIRIFKIAENIKKICIEYMSLPKDDKSVHSLSKDSGEKKLKSSFEWGKKEETKDILPNFLYISVSFWDDKFIGEHFFTKFIPIFVFEKIEKEKTAVQEQGAPGVQKEKMNEESPAVSDQREIKF